MLDKFNREITYLRLSVTDKCNLRCFYCMPEEGIPRKRHSDFLSLEAMAEVVSEAAGLGIRKVRLTGGEPLIKRGIVDLIAMIKGVDGLEHLAMTTNGTLLEQYAADLKQAGLDSLNISLDTLDELKYRTISRGGDIRQVLRGIEAARAAGFPLKINMVVFKDTRPDERARMGRFCREKNIKLQMINHFSLGKRNHGDYRFDRPPDCSACNRIRLLADGHLKPCLHSDEEIKVDFKDIKGSLIRAVNGKPEKGLHCSKRHMIEIGG